MPYEYRTMTPDERQAIVDERRARGYPLHAPPHPSRGAGSYLLTAANYEHASIMASPERRTEFEALLLKSMATVNVAVHSWVVLPNHYHLLASVRSLDTVSRALGRLHGATSRTWNLQDSLTGQRKVWHRFADRSIRNDAHFYRALNYTHVNPMKHGYVHDPYEWPWSSVHDYVDTYGREWLREQWRRFPPDKMGGNWNEWESR